MPPLEHLCKAFLNQDWGLWGSNAADVLDLFGREDSGARVVGARDAAADLLARGLSDAELEAELEANGLGYAPDFEGMTHRDTAAA